MLASATVRLWHRDAPVAPKVFLVVQGTADKALETETWDWTLSNPGLTVTH